MGAKVILIGRNRENLQKACREIGDSSAALAHDITDLSGTEAIVKAASKIFSASPTILVNNAGTHLKQSALHTSPTDFESLMRTHVTAGHVLASAVLPAMLERRHGSILFMASMASYLGVPNVFAYSAAKSAVLGMTRALASEVSGRGVRVNAIAPGWIHSRMSEKALANDPQRRKKILSRTPIGTLGSAEDIGWSATYLCSPAAKFVTGTVLVVDGGASIGF